VKNRTGPQGPFDLAKRVFHNPQRLVVGNNLFRIHVQNIGDHTEITVPGCVLCNRFLVEGKVPVVVQAGDIPLIGRIGDKLFCRDLLLGQLFANLIQNIFPRLAVALRPGPRPGDNTPVPFVVCLIHGQVVVEPLVSSNIVKFFVTFFKHRKLHPDDKLADLVFTAQFRQILLRKQPPVPHKDKSPYAELFP